jgi:hypothetical protein
MWPSTILQWRRRLDVFHKNVWRQKQVSWGSWLSRDGSRMSVWSCTYANGLLLVSVPIAAVPDAGGGYCATPQECCPFAFNIEQHGQVTPYEGELPACLQRHILHTGRATWDLVVAIIGIPNPGAPPTPTASTRDTTDGPPPPPPPRPTPAPVSSLQPNTSCRPSQLHQFELHRHSILLLLLPLR